MILEAVAGRGARYRSNRVLALVRSIYRWGIAEDLIHFDPTQGVRPRTVERPPILESMLRVGRVGKD